MALRILQSLHLLQFLKFLLLIRVHLLLGVPEMLIFLELFVVLSELPSIVVSQIDQSPPLFRFNVQIRCVGCVVRPRHRAEKASLTSPEVSSIYMSYFLIQSLFWLYRLFPIKPLGIVTPYSIVVSYNGLMVVMMINRRPQLSKIFNHFFFG